MEKILTEEDKISIKNSKINKINQTDKSKEEKNLLIKDINNEKLITKSAYTISMLPLEIIKKHLKSTMKPYALIWQKNNKETFAASVYKDNNIICFNEGEIFKEIYDGQFYDILFRKEKINDFAFILNMYYLHENSSHNKEKIINSKEDSPFIFLDENLSSALIFSDENCDSGEAGCFTESFIADRTIILGLVNCKNNFGDLLNIKYFNQENFEDVKNIYNSRKTIEDKEENIDKEKNSFSSLFKAGKKDNNSNLENYDNVKRDIFGFTARDNYLFKEAKERHCYY